jgi:Ca-activated chloride channel homolog
MGTRPTRRSLLALWPAFAQDPPSPTFSVDVNLVTIAFLVRDRDGRLVPKLEKADFDVFENGQKQEIRVLTREQETPLTLGLILDRSPSQDKFEPDNIYAAITFFRSVLRPEDRAFISAFGNRIKLICDLTGSLDELERSLKRMNDQYDRAPRLGPAVNRSGGSAVFDAIFWPVSEKLRRVEGRKAVIMIGDGKENSSLNQLIDVIDVLQKDDVIFYGLDNGGDDSPSNRRLRDHMPTIAQESGGRVCDTSKVALRKAFEEIEAELRTMYTLAYASSNPGRDGRYRRIEIRPQDPRFEVRARPGYYAR